MGKFILVDFRKREEIAALQSLVPEICLKMDHWIKEYENDGTPPNEEEAALLEVEQVCKLLDEFDERAKQLGRAREKIPERRGLLERNLNRRKGNLFAKYSDHVSALQDEAAAVMTYCLETCTDFEEGLENLLPTVESNIDIVFQSIMNACNGYIEATFPGGVEAMDSYDSELPDGLVSFKDFQELVKKKEAQYKQKNLLAIDPAVLKVKENSKEMVKNKINEAILAAMTAIEFDLSDDVLPYLDESAMTALREELIASAQEYGNSRLDE
jgi:hypothetical protein